MSYKDPEKKKEYDKLYHQTHPRVRVYDSAKQKAYTIKSVLGNIPAYLFRVAKDRAKKRGVEFSISVEDVVVPPVCPVLDMDLVCGFGTANRSGGNWNSPSLDRIDNTKGYVKGNVQVISHLANSMKSVATEQQLLKFSEWVIKTYGND